MAGQKCALIHQVAAGWSRARGRVGVAGKEAGKHGGVSPNCPAAQVEGMSGRGASGARRRGAGKGGREEEGQGRARDHPAACHVPIGGGGAAFPSKIEQMIWIQSCKRGCSPLAENLGYLHRSPYSYFQG